MSANLRRSLNGDLKHESFRKHLSQYLGSFSKLVPESWNSLKELQSFTTGLNLNIMFADRSDEHAVILLAGPSSRGGDETSIESNRVFLDQLAHLMTVANKGAYYAIPLQNERQSDAMKTDFVCFQLLGFRPGHKKYMQRLTNWSSDIWHGALLCSTLGTFSVAKSGGNGHEFTMQPDLTVSFASSNVQPWSVKSFFKNDRVDHLYAFDHVQHEVGFDVTAIEDIMNEIEDSEAHDIDLVNLGKCTGKHFVCCQILSTRLDYTLYTIYYYQLYKNINW